MDKTTNKPAVHKKQSSILAAILESVDGLHREGIPDQATLDEFKALCRTDTSGDTKKGR